MERDTPPIPFEWDDAAGRDQVVVLRGITWQQYVAINNAIGETPRPRMAYLDGELEVMTMSRRHELVKIMLGRLVEAFAEEMDIPLDGYGNTTWQKEAELAGLEPDECYSIGELGEFPDLAIEVVHTSGGINKLEIYRRLSVSEVWFWINGRVYVYRLAGKYKLVANSVALPGIDLDAIAHIIATTRSGGQTAAVRAFRKTLHKPTGST
ncbi:MAG TPA: Uma2 family endonuclease [Kofleriaceae bacterium]